MRYLLLFILVYFIYRGIKFLFRLFMDTGKSDKRFNNQNSDKPTKSGVDTKDIVDAEFEDIDESE